MAITPNEETFELLTPSVTLLPVLTGLRSALARLDGIKTGTTSRVWDDIPVTDVAAGIARFSLWNDGYEEGVIPMGNSDIQNDINHRLSTDFEIMSPEDLAARFKIILNRSLITSRYRRLSETPDITRLYKDNRALGWQGFDIDNASDSEKQLIRNRRMFIDYFRQDFDWTALRGIEIAEAAALIEYALYMEMISPEDATFFSCRITIEAITRYDSWNTFAKSLLIAKVFIDLNNGEKIAFFELQKTEEMLINLLENFWQLHPWPRLSF